MKDVEPMKVLSHRLGRENKDATIMTARRRRENNTSIMGQAVRERALRQFFFSNGNTIVPLDKGSELSDCV